MASNMEDTRRECMIAIAAAMNKNSKRKIKPIQIKNDREIKFNIDKSKLFRRRYLKGDVSSSSEESDDWYQVEHCRAADGGTRFRDIDNRKHKKRRVSKVNASKIPPRRSQRIKEMVDYTEISEKLEDDSLLYCHDCKYTMPGECISHRITWVLNRRINCSYVIETTDPIFKNYFDCEASTIDCKCKGDGTLHVTTSLPNGLVLNKSKIPNAGLGVWTKRNFSKGTMFGPYLGQIIYVDKIDDALFEKSATGYEWLVRASIWGVETHLVNALDPMKSNWLRFVNCARNKEEQNMEAVQYHGVIFYRLSADIVGNTELLTYYGAEYARDLGIDMGRRKCRVVPQTGAIRSMDVGGRVHRVGGGTCTDVERTVGLTDEEIDNIEYRGHKVTKEMFGVIARLCRDDPSMTREDILSSLKSQLPDCADISTDCISVLTHKYSLRRKRASTTKMDEEMLSAIRDMIEEDAHISAAKIRSRLVESMSHKRVIGINRLFEVIKARGLRPVDCLEEDEDRVAMVVRLHREDPRIPLDEVCSHLAQSFPSRAPIGREKIDAIIRKNKLRNSRNTFRKMDDEMMEVVASLVKEQPRSTVEDIGARLRVALPDKPVIGVGHLKSIVAGMRQKYGSNIKMDDEMIDVVRSVLMEQPRMAGRNVNDHVRETLPDKPRVCDDTICRLIKKYGLRPVECGDN